MARKEKEKLNQLHGLLEQRLLPCPPGLPQSEEEEYAFTLNLVRLKAMRMTTRECALKMGVSVGTVKSYLGGESYKEMRERLVADTKDRGHLLVSEILDDAMRVHHDLMLNAKSEFVKLKCVELAYESAGLRQPKEEAKGDSRDAVAIFLKQVEEKRRQQPVYNIQNVNVTQQTEEKGDQIVESVPQLPPGVPAEMARFHEQVGPGGTLPPSFRASSDLRKKRDLPPSS